MTTCVVLGGEGVILAIDLSCSKKVFFEAGLQFL